MLGFKINNEDLELPPGTVLEIERNNPYLQFNNEIVGEYSLPFEFDATPTNIRLTNYAPLLQQRVNADGIKAVAYDNGFQDSIGKIKIEKPVINLNRTQDGRISAYYLTGFSYFNSDVKDKRLRDINTGGDRNFAWDNFTRNGAGFWGHLHKVLDAGTGYGTTGYAYAFYPVINKNFKWGELGEFGGEVMNNMEYVGGQVNFRAWGSDNKDGNPIVPFLYLLYVLRQIETYIGWKFDGAILQDADFAKITIENSKAIDWAIYKPARMAILGSGLILDGKANITFNLKENLPDVSIPEFLMAIRNRFGLSYDVDKRNKVVTFQKLSQVAANNIKNFTEKASPVITKTILTEKKIYSLKTTENTGAINLSGLNFRGDIIALTGLPVAAEALYQHTYFVIQENNYYICQQNKTNQVWQWDLYTYNTGDVIPAGATEEIITAALTTGNEKFNAYLDFIPRWDEAGFWPGRTEDQGFNTIIFLFYFGIRNNKAAQPIAFAGSHIYDSAGVQVGQWSLAFLAKKTDGTEVGLYALSWKPFLDKLTTREELSVTLYLTRNEYMQLRFSDVLSIANVRMYISRIKHTIPYNGQVQLECSRI